MLNKNINNKIKKMVFTATKAGIVILISVLAIFTVVKAGTITPPSEVSANFYTLSEIYNFITSNTTAVEAGHSFAFLDALEGTGKTLTEIYNALANLISADKVKLDTTYLGVAGTLVPSGGDALTENVLTGKTFFGDSQTDWNLKTGTMTNVGSQTITPTTSNTAITQGYHNGSGYCGGDADLLAGNIMADVDIFGVSGTLLKNVYNGSATLGATDYEFYTQALGGVDDYNDNQTAMPTSTYQGTWTDCTSGADNYCGTNDSNADAKDNSTGLIWSNWLDSGTTHTWFWANNCHEPGTDANPGACSADGDDACQCVKHTGGDDPEISCDALGNGWRLPYQKELMQAYINGSSKVSVSYLSNSAYYYWASTTVSFYTPYAWFVYLDLGSTGNGTKTTSGSYKVRCVRQ